LTGPYFSQRKYETNNNELLHHLKKSNAIFILHVNFECYVVSTSSMATQASDLEDPEYDPNIADNISSEVLSDEIDEDVVKRPPPSTVEIKSLESGKKWYNSLILSFFCFEDKKLAPPKPNENIKGCCKNCKATVCGRISTTSNWVNHLKVKLQFLDYR